MRICNHVSLNIIPEVWSQISLVNTLNFTLVKHQNISLDLHVFTKSWPMMPMLMKILQLFGRSRPVHRSTTLKYREARRYLSDFLRSPSRKGRRTVCWWWKNTQYWACLKEHFYQWNNLGCKCWLTNWNPDSKWINVLFSFAPKNAFIKTARLYKSVILLNLKVKTRQLRLSHQD